MKILCYGDSNTFGYDPRGYFADRYEADDRWVDLLARDTGWEWINAGVNGREIPRVLYTPLPLSPHDSIDILLMMLGTNDLLQGYSAKEAAVRMEAFLSQALPYYPKICLVSPPPTTRGAWVTEDQTVAESIALSEEYRQIASKLNILFVDTCCWNIELAFDGVHFTEAGHHAFARQLREALKTYL